MRNEEGWGGQGMATFVKNKRIDEAIRKRHRDLMGYDYPEERQSGRTTGRALYFIGKAMTNPGEWIKVTDHNRKINYERQANLMCLVRCRQLIKELKLDFFLFQRHRNPPRICYDVFECEGTECQTKLRRGVKDG
jgi:hypothetical protein